MHDTSVRLSITTMLSVAKQKHISYASLCKEAGLHTTTLLRWSTGATAPTYSNYIKFKKAFNKLCRNK